MHDIEDKRLEKFSVKRSRKIGLMVGCLALAIGMGIWWQKSTTKSGQGQNAQAVAKKKEGNPFFSDVVPVRVEPVVKQDFIVYLNALGTVTAYNTVNVVSRVQGELVDIAFTEGQEVKVGDLLAVIDKRPYEAALMQAKGSVQQNQALLQNARSELARYQKLIKQDSIAKQTYESQVALVNQYQGALASSQAQLKDAQLNLEFTDIKAPIGGRVGIRQIDKGNYIRVGDSTPLVIITQTQPIATTFTLPETQLPEVVERLQTGEKLQVEAWNSGNTQLLATGEVETLDNQINTSTGTILVKARFSNDKNPLFPNQFVNVKLNLKVLHEVLVISTDAVQYGNKGAFVYVVNNNKVHIRAIKLGLSNADKTVVTEGLQVGEQIVLEGTDRLKEDTKVEVINPDTGVDNMGKKAGIPAQ